jgi:hypothetical protein
MLSVLLEIGNKKSLLLAENEKALFLPSKIPP